MFIGSGLRRSFKELGNEPEYWDERGAYYSPILRRMEEFFPSLRIVDLDFMNENLLMVLDDAIREWGVGNRVDGMGDRVVREGGERERGVAVVAARQNEAF